MITGLKQATNQEIYEAYCAARNTVDRMEDEGNEQEAAKWERVRQELRDEMFRRAAR